MDGFGTIRLHYRTIKRFRRFSKKITKSYSETLEAVMDFFEWHGISPFSRFAKQISQEEEKTRKRINALIAIIRDIEIHQTKPTMAMIQSLFVENLAEEEPLQIEKKFLNQNEDNEQLQKEEQTVSLYQFERLKEKHGQDNKRVLRAFETVSWVKPRFGTPYFKIEIEAAELSILKRMLRGEI